LVTDHTFDMHIFFRSVLQHDVDSCDNLGVCDWP